MESVYLIIYSTSIVFITKTVSASLVSEVVGLHPGSIVTPLLIVCVSILKPVFESNLVFGKQPKRLLEATTLNVSVPKGGETVNRPRLTLLFLLVIAI